MIDLDRSPAPFSLVVEGGPPRPDRLDNSAAKLPLRQLIEALTGRKYSETTVGRVVTAFTRGEDAALLRGEGPIEPVMGHGVTFPQPELLAPRLPNAYIRASVIRSAIREVVVMGSRQKVSPGELITL